MANNLWWARVFNAPMGADQIFSRHPWELTGVSDAPSGSDQSFRCTHGSQLGFSMYPLRAMILKAFNDFQYLSPYPS